MLQRLRELLREAPLLSLILVIWFLTAVIAIAVSVFSFEKRDIV